VAKTVEVRREKETGQKEEPTSDLLMVVRFHKRTGRQNRSKKASQHNKRWKKDRSAQITTAGNLKGQGEGR